ncbi:MAG TPA: ATP-binding protein [Anaerolineae bacterium]
MTQNLLSELNPLAPGDRLQTAARRDRLGIVVGGSLTDGLDIKIDRDTMIEGLAVGSYVTIDGQTHRRFFGLVTDIRLDAADPNLQKMPPMLDELKMQIYRGTSVYGVLHVKPMLVLEEGSHEPKPIKTVPAHFTTAYRATPEEVSEIFADAGIGNYQIGSSVEDDNIKINLNLEQFVERSSGVFGRSGTGKTFLTLPLLASVIKQDVASVLIFDMHNDYGYTLKGDKKNFKGLKKLTEIGSRVIVVTLDPDSSNSRKTGFEFAFTIGYDQIEPEDLESMQQLLSLTDIQVNALYMLSRLNRKDWVRKLLSDEDDEETESIIDKDKLAGATYYAIQRKLKRLLKFKFIREHSLDNYVDRILAALTSGKNVVVEFGRYGNELPAYVFVANYITRRIHDKYVELKDAAEGGGVEPRKLMIAVEEAHKFLEPSVAGLTIFGTIARELRKYNVTLLIVDQRPSQIDDEVMSQIGTRITCALSDEKDINAVFTGMSGSQQLRSVLASLDSKQQALIMGHAVPMPVVVKTREYGQAIYDEFSGAVKSPEENHRINQRRLGRLDDDSVI